MTVQSLEIRTGLCYTDSASGLFEFFRKGVTAVKVAIVDDDKQYLADMEALCREYGQKRDCPMEVFPFSGGKAFLAALANTRFSIAFLDIYMEDTDGITTAKALRETNPNCILIFLTSSREFMPEAFSCHAFDYIPKPAERERVERVLDDARKILPSSHKYIDLVHDRKTRRVHLRDIVFAVTDAHYLEVVLSDGSALRPRMTASEFLQLTGNDSRFILANRGVILNAGHIRSFGDGCCMMDNGVKLPLRVRDARRVEQAVMDHNFETIRRRQSMEEE